MKSKITKRLVFTNLAILTMALLCFFVITVCTLNAQAMKQSEQLIVSESIIIIERTTNTDSVFSSMNRPKDEDSSFDFLESQNQSYFTVVQNENSSTHVFCGYDNESGLLVFPDFEDIPLDDVDIENISSLIIDEPTSIDINNENYLVLVSPYQTDYSSTYVVSFLALDEIITMRTSNIELFAIVFAVLIAISFLLIFWQSLKITKPIKKLTLRSKEYANHDFSKPFTINTGDEIESLSNSIGSMVESIVSYEQTQLLLFRNLSHELKTPLTAISGYAQNIQNGYYKDENVPLTVIQDECKRIRDILDNLIFLNKINSNVETFTFEETDLVSLVTMCIEKVESIAVLKEIDIIYNPPEKIMVSCDYDKIVRACINVLSNALKHTKDYIEIELSVEYDFACIKISDNGNGFAESKLKKLFSTTTGETIDGNGIGLLIVYEMVKRHDGNIYVDNKPDGGAEVIIHLPRL